MNGNQFPDRRHPAHGVKAEFGDWVIVFVTVCTKDRIPWLADPDVHERLRAIWQDTSGWLVGRYVIMPDHIHLFAGNAGTCSLDKWVRFWKTQFSMHRRQADHQWQTDHWDTRLRSHESYDAKWDYVRNNPVRHGLVARVDDWPYQGQIHPLPWF